MKQVTNGDSRVFTSRENDIAEYRRQAELARELAHKARVPEVREGLLKMAIEWDKLVDAAANRRR